MAGIRDTPQDRAVRDAAMRRDEDADRSKPTLWVPDGARPTAVPVAVVPEVVEDVPIPTTTYGRRPGRGERPQAVVASGYRFKLDGTDKRVIGAMKLRRQTWQLEAWDYVDEVPEAGHMVEFVSNLISKLRLFPAVRPEPNSPPVPVDDEEANVDPTYAKIAQAVLDRLGFLGTILGDLTYNFEVCGEALDLDTLVATPTGFTRMGDLAAGDEVLGGDGRPCRVVVAHPVHENRDCYEVRLAGGIRVVADGEHLWATHPQRDRQYARQWGRRYEPTVLTTVEMARTLHSDAGSGKAANHAIEITGIDGAGCDLPIDPYVLGYWLGDGTSTQGCITVHHDDQPHLREQVETAGYGWSPRMAAAGRGFQIGVAGLQARLRRAGLLGNKHIPDAYLRAPEADRWALLQGLIDSDGHIDRRGRVEFSNINRRLLWGVVELASSLGLRPGEPRGHRVFFNSAGKPVARLPRKAERIAAATEGDRWRYVQEVEQVKSRPVRCITVDSADGTFLVTPHFVRTHNCYLHGHEDDETGDETWLIRSIDEIIVQGDSFAIRGLPGTATTGVTPIPDGDIVIRLWMQHRRFRTLATCSMRRTLSILENLLLLDRELRATSQSRLPNGILVFPQEMSFGPIDPTSDTGDGEGRSDVFLSDFDDAVRTAIQEPGAASAAAPITLQTRAEWIDKIRFIEFSRKLDDTLEKRTEAQTMRAARGLAMPVEVTTGLQECADEETEILTVDGWRRWDAVAAGDRVLTLNHGRAVAEWQEVERVAVYDVADQPLVAFEGKAHSSLTTLNHRWPVLSASWGSRSWRESADITTDVRFQTAAPNVDVPTEAKYADAFVELVAWFYTEGHVDRRAHRDGGVTIISQSLERNPANVDRIRAALMTLVGDPLDRLNRTGPTWKNPARPLVRGWVEGRDKNRPMVRFRLSHPLTAELEAVAPDKVPTAEFIRSLTAAQLELFLDTSRRADGWTTNGGTRMFSQADPARVDAYEMACILSGRTPSRSTSIAQSGPYAGRPTFLCSVTDRTTVQPVSGRRPAGTRPYTGVVWCPSVPNGTWMARRHGHVYFTGNTTFANAAQVKRSEWDSYGEPKAMTIVDALTTGYYQWQLEEAGIPHEEAVRHFIWYDPTDCVAAPDPVDSADKGLEDGLINGAAWRRVKGWSEGDAPDNDELLLRMLLKVTRPDPFVVAQLLKSTGIAPDLLIPAPLNGILGPGGEMPEPKALPPSPNPTPEQGGPPAEIGTTQPGETPNVSASATVDLLIAANATQHHLGRVRGAMLSNRLAQIDLHLRTRVHTAAEQAVRRMLERAGNKVKQRAARKGGDVAVRKVAAISDPKQVTAALGAPLVAALDLSESDLTGGAFDDLLDEFDTWTRQAQEQALAAMRKAGVDLSDAGVEELKAAQDQHREAGAGVLASALGALAGTLLFTPPGAQPGGEAEVGANVPMGLIRAALAVAGGDTVRGRVDGALTSGARGQGGVGGVAAGPDVIDAATGDGGAVEGWVWDYGSTPRSPYEPHLALDGYVFEDWEDDALANDEDWPDVPYYFPGDHEWCACDSHAVLILPDGTDVEDTGQTTDESAAPEEQ